MASLLPAAISAGGHRRRDGPISGGGSHGAKGWVLRPNPREPPVFRHMSLRKAVPAGCLGDAIPGASASGDRRGKGESGDSEYGRNYIGFGAATRGSDRVIRGCFDAWGRIHIGGEVVSSRCVSDSLLWIHDQVQGLDLDARAGACMSGA
jgi:hypothetical protein